jgi:octaprenyl-diphosphate synthase
MLEKIRGPVEEEMQRFNTLLVENYRHDNLFITTLTDYVLGQRGKQMRPLLVLLSAALNGGITERSYTGAILVEMAHSASLVHDDVIDEASMRRGKPSVNAIWRSRTAVLTGDYLLARALSITARGDASDLLTLLIDSFEKLCEGELIQLDHAAKLDMTEAAYFEVIYRKTASLLGAAGAIGARSAGASDEAVGCMKRFGECIGMAFQIRDDLLDYESSAETGKAAGNDLRERKITLPLLHLLNCSDEAGRNVLIDQLAVIHDHDEYVAEIQQKVIASGAAAYAGQVMVGYEKQALAILENYPDSPVRRSLEGYCHYILKRNR